MATLDLQDKQTEAAPRRAADARLRERRCIVSRQSGDTGQLIRFARAPDGTVVPDIREELPGRGCWVGVNRDLVARAVEKRLFSRAFKADAQASADLADLVERLLRDDALGLLAMARKAGTLVLGEMQVLQAIRETSLACVIHARDGAENGLKKVIGALHGAKTHNNVLLVREFTGAELNLALGLPNVIHAGVPTGRLGTAFAEKARKLAAYRGNGGLATAEFISDRSAGPADCGQDTGSWDE